MDRTAAVEPPTLRQKLDAGAWEVRRMAGDGNCLFRGVAEQVYADAELCDTVRQQTVDFERAFRDKFSQFVTGNFEAYLNRMSCSGTLGDHPEIQAMAELYCRPIEVYSGETMERLNVYQCSEKTDNAPLRLLYVGGNHYDCIIDKERPSVGVGLGMPGLEHAAKKAVETEVTQKVMLESEKDSNESQLVRATMAESELLDEERRLMESAMRESAAEVDAQLLERQLLEAAMVESVVASFAGSLAPLKKKGL